MSKLDLNLDLNLDLDLAAGFGGGSGGRSVRFDSFDYVKFVDTEKPLIPAKLPRYNRVNWDPAMLSYDYLGEFLANRGWFDKMVKAAGTPPEKLPAKQLEEQIRRLIVLAESRHERFTEILDQDSGARVLTYFFGAVKADARSAPNTLLLVHATRRIGEMVTMTMKSHFSSPRPSALCPVLMPMIDAPATASFPGGHSLQADMIARALAHAFPGLPQIAVLSGIAKRVGANREIAGIHYERDTQAGLDVSKKCMELVVKGKRYAQLVKEAQAEFPYIASKP